MLAGIRHALEAGEEKLKSIAAERRAGYGHMFEASAGERLLRDMEPDRRGTTRIAGFTRALTHAKDMDQALTLCAKFYAESMQPHRDMTDLRYVIAVQDALRPRSEHSSAPDAAELEPAARVLVPA